MVADWQTRMGLPSNVGRSLDSQVGDLLARARDQSAKAGRHAPGTVRPQTSGPRLAFSQAGGQAGNTQPPTPSPAGRKTPAADAAGNSTTQPPPPPPARVRPPLTGDPQFGPKHPITGNKPTPPADASFTQEALAIPDPEIHGSITAMKENGHAWDRHGPEVTDDQLALRAMHGVDPISQTLENGEKPGEKHKAARHATQFTSERAMAQAQRAVENTNEFKAQLAKAHLDPTHDFFVIDAVGLEAALGSSYKDHCRGKTRSGSSKNPTGVTDTDLSDGHVVVAYIKTASGEFKIYTMYPNPKSNEHHQFKCFARAI